jgi:hypothetical protein
MYDTKLARSIVEKLEQEFPRKLHHSRLAAVEHVEEHRHGQGGERMD